MSLPAPTGRNGSDGANKALEGEYPLNPHIDSISAPDDGIEKRGDALTKGCSGHEWNSKLKVNKLPNEVLGEIFHWNVMFKDDFGGLEERSHNFLQVCHHWHEVALGTPGIWSFWGNTLRDWKGLCSLSRMAPLDLVLDSYEENHLDGTLVDALEGRAQGGTIRRVHLKSTDAEFLISMLSTLTPKSEEVQLNPIESFILCNFNGALPVNVSDFFASSHFPNLQHLQLIGCTISSWDYLSSRINTLTDLHLDLKYPPPNSTTSQLLSVLKSNPLLQAVTLSDNTVPDSDDSSSFSVPLKHLRHLKVTGDSQHVLRVLGQLDHPVVLEKICIILSKCTVKEISQIIGPYFRKHIQHLGHSQSGLKLHLLPSGNHIRVQLGSVVGMAPEPMEVGEDAVLEVSLDSSQPPLEAEVVLGLISHCPLEELVYLKVVGEIAAIGDIYTRLSNLRTLNLTNVPLAVPFPENSGADRDVLSSLQNLILNDPTLDECDWDPLTSFLTDRVSSGKQLDIFVTDSESYMCVEVVERIKGLVQKFHSDLAGRGPRPFYIGQ